MKTSFLWNGTHRKHCELTPWANMCVCPTCLMWFVCFDYAEPWSGSRGWTRWEKLESNIIEPCVGYQDHRCTFPKVELFVTRISLVCISFHKRTDHRPEFSGMKHCCPRPGCSAHRYCTEAAPHTKTETASPRRVKLRGWGRPKPVYTVQVDFISAVWRYSRKSVICLAVLFTTLPLWAQANQGYYTWELSG